MRCRGRRDGREASSASSFAPATMPRSTRGSTYVPCNAVVDAQVARNRTVQYFSYPDHPWKLLREQSPGAYEAYAGVRPGEWTRLRIEVRG